MPFQKNILLSLCGHTPQILTETLYCLMIDADDPVHIDEIWVVTTQSGKDKVCTHLLDEQNGRFFEFCHDYNIDPDSIKFTTDQIIAPDDMSDIRNVDDNESFANILTQQVWNLTAEPSTVLYCSIAGGRKTMSAYLAMIMQFFARPQDHLIHVIIDPPEFENTPDFFYPPVRETIFKNRFGKEKKSTDIHVIYSDIPFVRLRDKLNEFTNRPYSFTDMVQCAQQWVTSQQDFPQLIIDSKSGLVHIGNHYSFELPRLQRCVYQLVANYSVQRNESIPVLEYEKYFMKGGKLIPKEIEDTFHKLYKNPDFNLQWEKVQQAISRINKYMRDQFPDFNLLEYYQISILGDYSQKCYGLKLDKKYITIL